MVPRRAGESQRAFVERTLRETGRIDTYDALYNAEYEDGRRTSITRLAAIVHNLRSEGWSIETDEKHGALAIYRLAGSAVWRCTACGGTPGHEPTSLLGGLGEAFCFGCNTRRTFQKRVAA